MGRKPKDAEQSVINKIEFHRTKAGLSRQELADKVDVHYQTIGYIERGEYSPSLVLALKISKALGKKVEQVFEIEEEKS